MANFSQISTMPVPLEVLRRYHERPGAFGRLCPPWERLRVVEQSGTIRTGDRLKFQIRKPPMWITWEALHADLPGNAGFIDEQVRGPFAFWRHEHRMFPDRRGRGGEPDPGLSVLEDAVEYRLPMGALGATFGGGFVRGDLERMFVYRHARTRLDLMRHGAFLDRPRLRVVVAGATGVIGRALCAFLSTGGHEVRVLSRGGGVPVGASYDGTIPWDPARGMLDAAALEGVDAIVHLGGANIGGQRWSQSYKREILESRTKSTELLARTIAGLRQKPSVFVCASAIGIYGNRGEEPVDESSSAGTDFLAEVCTKWEGATRAAEDAGVRTARLRIGVVITPAGGMVQKLKPWFGAGLGMKLGSGKQWLPWIGLDDTIGAIHQVLMDDGLSGAVNVVSPNPVRMVEFADVLARVMRRPRLLAVPGWALGAAMGEMGRSTALRGTRVTPGALDRSGFGWLTPNLEACVRWELGRLPRGSAKASEAGEAS